MKNLPPSKSNDFFETLLMAVPVVIIILFWAFFAQKGYAKAPLNEAELRKHAAKLKQNKKAPNNLSAFLLTI